MEVAPLDEPLAAPPQLEQVRLYLPDGVVDGQIDPAGQRVSDWLRDRSFLRLSLMEGEWLEVEVASVVIIAPPPWPADPQRRLHRLRHRAALRAEPYVVVGTAHLPPGNRLDRSVLARRSAFLPITDAAIDGHLEPRLEEEVPVALVNIARITELAELKIRL